MTLHIKTAQIPRQPTLCLQGHLLQPFPGRTRGNRILPTPSRSISKPRAGASLASLGLTASTVIKLHKSEAISGSLDSQQSWSTAPAGGSDLPETRRRRVDAIQVVLGTNGGLKRLWGDY